MKYTLPAYLLTAALFGVQFPIVAEAANQPSTRIAQANTNSYIGLQYSDVPAGLTNLGGWVVNIGSDGNFNFGVSRVSRGTQEMLWFSRFLRHDAQGKASWRVLDVLQLPKIQPSQALVPFCVRMQNGRKDRNLITIAKVTNTEYWTTIDHAWRLNPATKKFEKTSTRGIVCENPGWGV